MSRMSLDEAKRVLQNRGYVLTITGKSEWIVSKDKKMVAGPFNGRSLVKYAKEVLGNKGEEAEHYRRIREELRKEATSDT